jgi:predicted MPP superfamily phosphohydrolase
LRKLKPSYRIAIIIGIIGSVALLCVGYGYFIEPQRLIVRHEELAIKNWNPAFDGLRIAMIGDIHGGSNGAEASKLRELVALVNAEDVDLIVLLGDYVSQHHSTVPIAERDLRMPISEVADNIAGMKARYGVLAVLGNHDGWFSDDKVTAELTRVGYRVLQDELVTIEQNGKTLRLLGLRDHLKVGSWQAFSADARNVASSTEGTGDLIVLEHGPDVLPMITGNLAISADLKLMLCAHTHGGQVWLPILGRPVIPSSYGQKYAYGHIYDRGLDMWVTAGIGTSILPFRFMVPPEITVLTVKSAS